MSQKYNITHESWKVTSPEEDYERLVNILRVKTERFRDLHASDDQSEEGEIEVDRGQVKIVSPHEGRLFILQKNGEEYEPLYDMVFGHEALVEDQIIEHSPNGHRQLLPQNPSDVYQLELVDTTIGRINIETTLNKTGREY